MSPAEKLARKIVGERSNGLCEVSLDKRATDWAHRQHRSRGGPWCPSNGLHISREMHTWQHAHPIDAEKLGWTVPTGVDPATVPVWLARWGFVYLLPNGGFKIAAGEEVS